MKKKEKYTLTAPINNNTSMYKCSERSEDGISSRSKAYKFYYSFFNPSATNHCRSVYTVQARRHEIRAQGSIS